MGEVFLARQEALGGFRRTVVLKRLLPDVEGDDEMVRRFLDEARVAAALAHENVVSILEVGDDGAPYLALEYVHGQNAGKLRTAAKKKQIAIPVVVAARMIADSARGLAHAHEAHDVEGRPLKIVHRDVSPKNIFVRVDGVSKIGDFGIAKSEHRLSQTAAGAVPGTLSYMSPEQARGLEVDALSDQFSLGIVLWELLAGVHLFKSESPEETLRSILTKKVPAPSSRRAEAKGLDRIALRMLAREPMNRYANLVDAALAIETAMPEVRSEVGQRAVAAFVEQVLGDELHERMRRIESGPDQTERVERPSFSLPPDTSSKESSDTPATATVRADPTRADRRGSKPSQSFAPPSPSRRVLVRRLWAAAPSLRAPVVVAAVALVAVGLGAAAANAKFRQPTPDERTLAYLEDAQQVNPTLHRAVFLAMADLAHVDEARAAPVADQLIALQKERLALLVNDQKRHGVDRQRVQARERALLAQARQALTAIPNEDLRSDELDMWEYDSSGPLRWTPPDAPLTIQKDLQDAGLAYLKSQAPMRKLAVDRLLAGAGVDKKAVHAWLDPMVSQREQLVEQSATAPESQLAALDHRIADLASAGEKRLIAACGRTTGHAIAMVGFENAANPDEWSPLFDTPPSVREQKARDGAPQTH
jgi:serine/threonine protein kinase